ncbi:MAG: Sua5/YciO/YrdC/YwlC family protein [Candidatus Magasanikbacteria bacterium]|nr:Sua5/YciO/YrdC/YwlC family protein [Candidatus Magasanikbacteria bacterium]
MKILTECNLAELVVDILNGKIIVFPTETSYGLGCDATNQQAVDKIFKIKGRDFKKPLLVVVPSIAEAKKYLAWSKQLEEISKKYWPGALTVVGEYRHPSSIAMEGVGGGLADGDTRPHPTLPFAKGRGREFRFERIAGYISSLVRRRELRKNQTKAELILWNHLRDKRLNGIRFRRQHGVGSYIVDFFQPDTKLVIELDGDVHYVDKDQVEKDRLRTKWLVDSGYKVIRFDNLQVFNNLDAVLDSIIDEVFKNRDRVPPSIAMEGAGGRIGSGIARGVISQAGTIALRVTTHPLLKSITEKIGRPLVATSANLSDAGEIYDAKILAEQFKNQEYQPDIMLDYGILTKNKPSTLVSVLNSKIKILRQGEVYVDLA